MGVSLMARRLAFKTFSMLYPRFLGLGMLVFIPLCVFVDTLCGNTDDLDGLMDDTWDALQGAWHLMVYAKAMD